jgi:hypothetical protein
MSTFRIKQGMLPSRGADGQTRAFLSLRTRRTSSSLGIEGNPGSILRFTW